MKAILLLFLSVCILLSGHVGLVAARCNGMPVDTDECGGSGLSSPAHQTALFSSSSLPSSVDLSFNIDDCDRRRYQRVLTYVSLNQGQQQFMNQTLSNPEQDHPESIAIRIPLATENTVYHWAASRECWEKRKGKKDSLVDVIEDLIDDAPWSTPPEPGEDSRSWRGDFCYVKDKAGDRDDQWICSREFTFCRRQPDTELNAPKTGQVFQQTNIPFSWSDITPGLPICASVPTVFVYQVFVWNTGSPLSPSIFNISVPIANGASYSWSPSGLQTGTYYWSVRTVRIVPNSNVVQGSTATTVTQFAPLQSFRYCTADIPPTAPSLQSPGNGAALNSATFTSSPNGPAINVTLTWSAASFGTTCNPGTTMYTVTLARNAGFTSGVISYNIAGSLTSLSLQLTDGGWHWKVAAKNGVSQAESSSRSFTVCVLRPPSSFSTTSPQNNEQGVIYTSILFSWGASTIQSSCTPPDINYTLSIGPSSTTFTQSQTLTATQATVTLTPGTWYWMVVATDSQGQSTSSSVSSFVTVSTLCVDANPTAGSLMTPTYHYRSGAVEVDLAWTTPNLGMSCSGSADPNFVLSIVGSGIGYSNSHNLTISSLSGAVTGLPVGTFTWTITVYNAGGVSAVYPQGSIEIPDISATTSFAGSFSPADGHLDSSRSVTEISWSYLAPPTTFQGKSMTYLLTITGATTIVLPIDQTTTSYSISNLQSGTWTWTLSSVVSDIPISELPTTSYTNTFSTCIPSVPSNAHLRFPPRFTQLTHNQANFTWTDSHNNTDLCTPYYTNGAIDERYTYRLYLSRTSSFPPQETTSISVHRNQGTDFSYLATNLTSGTYFWRIRVTKEVLINSVPTNTLTQTTIASAFTICLSTPPTPPTLLFPANGTAFQRCNITTILEWVPLTFSDFGVDCSNTPVNKLTIELGTNPANLPFFVEVLSDQSASDRFSVLDFEPSTVYYWRVVIANSVFNATSEVFSFKTPNTAATACSGHGACNNQGTCTCSAGYTGVQCAQVLPTQPHGTQDQNQGAAELGPIIGGVAGGLFLILLLAFAAFFVLRRKAKKLMEKPVRPPPDFPPLAFTVPPGYPPLATEKIVPWYSFEQLLVGNGFAVPFALLDMAQPAEVDEVVRCLVYIIESHGQGANFINALITKDLREKKASNTLSSATLFRDNSHASKAFKTYSKIVGLPYIFYAYGDILYEMCNAEPDDAIDATKRRSASIKRNGSEVDLQQVVVRKGSSRSNSLMKTSSFEVDPTKMSEEDDGLVNAISLQLRCQKLLVQLFRSQPYFPTPLRRVFVHLMAEVQQYLNAEDGYNAVAAFVFLRLVNPAILFPHQYGLVEVPPGEGMNRQLILVTKVLQNLANGVHFGNKEQHMLPLNDFIDSNKAPLRNFLDGVVSNPEAEEFSSPKLTQGDEDEYFKPLAVPRPAVETSLSVVYGQFYRNRERVPDLVARYRSTDEVKIITNKSSAIMENIGEPVVPSSGTSRQS